MKISRRWLGDFLPPESLPDGEALAALLTGRGLEVESQTAAASASGLVGGEVLEVSPHPSADKLKVCKVNVGKKQPSDIVCGASNVAAGLRVVVAPPGAMLGENKMQKRAIRGVESAGMLCSAAEIGVGRDDGGIMTLDDSVAAGLPLDELLQLNDEILDAGITPNRGDCLGHLGIAREIDGFRVPYPPEVPDDFRPSLKEKFPVEIDSAAQDACPFYTCILIRNADAGRPSPWRLKTRLERCGLRAINAAVDVTNYMMLSLGQPLHAFDLDALAGGIRVRRAGEGESLQLLDGQTIRCAADTLLIADHNKAVAMAGVMGGMESAVHSGTKNILLEAAHFAPDAVRGKTMCHGLTSDAAYRFERGADPQLPARAVMRAAVLLQSICGGEIGMLSSAGAPPAPAPPIAIRGDSLRGALGADDIGGKQAATLLSSIGIAAEVKGTGAKETIHARPPSWRFDLERPADLTEEVIRLRGYDTLPDIAPPGGLAIPPLPPLPFAPSESRRRLASLGFAEIITFAFVPPKWETLLDGGRGAPIRLQNPIHQDMSVMRTTLLGGLLDRAMFNLNHRCDSPRLFEIGRCFVGGEIGEDKNGGGKELPWRQTQPLYAAGLAAGLASPPQWGAAEREIDFFDLRGWLETFLRGCSPSFVGGEAPEFLHPLQSAAIDGDINGKTVRLGAAGVLHPAVAAEFGFRRPPLVFELCLEPLLEIRRLPRARPSPRHPAVRRDLSAVLPSSLPAGEALASLRRAAAGTPIREAALFDRWRSDKLGADKICYGIRLTMQGDGATLTDREINEAVQKAAAALTALGAELRQ